MSHNIYKRIEVRRIPLRTESFSVSPEACYSFHFISYQHKAYKAFLSLCVCRAYIDNGFIHRDTLL